MRDVSIGIAILDRIASYGIDKEETKILMGDQDVSNLQFKAVQYKNAINMTLRRANSHAFSNYRNQLQFETLPDRIQISQAVRDGIILKKETREEIIDGKKVEVTYDTPMTIQEVNTLLDKYYHQLIVQSEDKISNYLNLGLSTAGLIGMISKGNDKKKQDDSTDKPQVPLTACSIAFGALRLIYGKTGKTDREKLREESIQNSKIKDSLLSDEQVSRKAEEDLMEHYVQEEKRIESQLVSETDKEFLFDLTVTTAMAIIYGMYIADQAKKSNDGKIDGRAISKAIVSLGATNQFTKELQRSIENISNNRNKKEAFEDLCKKVAEIEKQMEEKVYVLEGASHPFDSFEIRNMNGRFYPKTNYKTGEKEFSVSLQVPEFSAKRGDVILLSGESGSGKSTFLRFLKRGDSDNRCMIKLNTGEVVDNLGNEYISFKPNINLSEETNALFQITGKKNASDLTEDEINKIKSIFGQLKFNSDTVINDLASKKITEFSTGQQKRLALSKLFYRIDDGTSVVIVDEPVGNVENSLIREQLEMIRDYAREKNVILILVTHRTDLVEDLITKSYHITEDGILEEVDVNVNKVAKDLR